MGTQNINTDNVIQFPKGLIGLSEKTQLQLFHELSNNEPTVHWLQSVSDTDFSMSVISPHTLGMEYNIEFSDDELQLLQLDDPSDALILLAIYKQIGDNNDIKVVTKAPIIINAKTNRGMQKYLDEVIFQQ